MAGISDLPFRILNRKAGCEFAFVEMLNVRSLGYKSRKTQQMLSSDPEDRPLGVQILGAEENYILRGLDILKGYKFDLLDFNAACPVKKVVRRGEGAALLKEPKKLQALLKLIVKQSNVPVTVKIRIGWDKNCLNAKEVALAAQDAGVSAVFVHGRTKAQGYSGQVDYQAIKQVKDSLTIPVIASGDILSAALAEKMFKLTGCDAVAIARGALGNPWIFRETVEFLNNAKVIAPPAKDQIIKAACEHFNMCVDFYGEKNAVVIFRKFFSWYTKGFRKVRPLREKASRLKSKDAMLELIRSCDDKTLK